MKDEIKEIINDLQRVADRKCYPEDILCGSIAQEWVDYITNLQEKSNNQAEEINRLYKQREKFMKKYGYLKEENEKLQKRNKEIYNGFIATQEELSDYATRNEKASEYINKLLKADDIPLVDVILMTIKDKLGGVEE